MPTKLVARHWNLIGIKMRIDFKGNRYQRSCIIVVLLLLIGCCPKSPLESPPLQFETQPYQGFGQTTLMAGYFYAGPNMSGFLPIELAWMNVYESSFLTMKSRYHRLEMDFSQRGLKCAWKQCMENSQFSYVEIRGYLREIPENERSVSVLDHYFGNMSVVVQEVLHCRPLETKQQIIEETEQILQSKEKSAK